MSRTVFSILPGFVIVLSLACTSGSAGSGSESDGGSSTSDGATGGPTTTQGATMSGGGSVTASGASDSNSSATSGSTTVSSESDATTDPTEGLSTSDGTTSDGTTSDGTTSEGTTDCVPSEEICNGIDDDCNDLVDDVDVGMDGICDCLNILIVGNRGANPSSEFETWLEAQGTKVDRVHTTPDESLTPELLAGYDIVLVDWLPRNYSAEEAAVLEEFISSGGGMMSLTGYSNSEANAQVTNSLISSIGLSYNTSKGWFSGPITQFADHPINEGLTSISFFGGLFINAVDDGKGVSQTIMTLPQGPVGVVQERASGRAFVFGDEWVEFDSEWKNVPQIKQFWVQTLRWLGPQSSCIVPG